MTQFTVVCENTALPVPGVLGEHGFAVFIETGGAGLLFDTGQGHTLLHNARCLGKDLAGVRKIFLSHGHFDHTGGLAQVLEESGEVAVYAHPDMFIERFVEQKKGEKKELRYVGPPETRQRYEQLGARFVFNTGFSEVQKDVYLTGEVPRKTAFEKSDRRLVARINGALVQDPLRDDQSLVVRTQRGLVVVLGCAHSGMINTLVHIRTMLPGDDIHMVFGGTHVGFLTGKQVLETIEALEGFSIDKIGVSHCTGLPGAMRFMEAFGEKFFPANAGSVITV